MVHQNSIAAYRSIDLNTSQEFVARAIRRETKAGRAATINSLFVMYNIPEKTGSPRIGELRMMTEKGIAFRIDGEEYAIVFAGKEKTQSGRTADGYKIERFAIVRAAFLEQQAVRGIGEQTALSI